MMSVDACSSKPAILALKFSQKGRCLNFQRFKAAAAKVRVPKMLRSRLIDKYSCTVPQNQIVPMSCGGKGKTSFFDIKLSH